MQIKSTWENNTKWASRSSRLDGTADGINYAAMWRQQGARTQRERAATKEVTQQAPNVCYAK